MQFPYRIALIADDHLDYSYGTRTDARGINLRVLDGYKAFHERMESIINSEPKVNTVLHAGDLFHRPQPSVRSIMTLKHYMQILHKEGISWYGTSGNHDSSDNRSLIPANAVMHDPDRGIHSLWKPYEAIRIDDDIFLHSVGYHGLAQSEAPDLEPEDGAINIFMTHGAAFDPANKTLMNCMDSPREQIIPPDIIMSDAFDFRALGHYHSRYAVGGPEMKTWYAGSSLRRGFSDAAGGRGWILITIYEDGKITAEPKDIWQRPQYDLQLIDASQYSASEVQELIMNGIASTRKDEGRGQFDEVSAPIVRQKVINATGSIRRGIDIQSVKAATGHMLSWNLEFTPPELSSIASAHNHESPDQDSDLTDSQGFTKSKTKNIVEGFKDWAPESVEFQTIRESDREKITLTATTFLQAAQDAEDEEMESQ